MVGWPHQRKQELQEEQKFHLRRASEFFTGGSVEEEDFVFLVYLFCIDLNFVGLVPLLAEKINQTMKLHVTKHFVYTLRNIFSPLFERKKKVIPSVCFH